LGQARSWQETSLIAALLFPFRRVECFLFGKGVMALSSFACELILTVFRNKGKMKLN